MRTLNFAQTRKADARRSVEPGGTGLLDRPLGHISANGYYSLLPFGLGLARRPSLAAMGASGFNLRHLLSYAVANYGDATTGGPS